MPNPSRDEIICGVVYRLEDERDPIRRHALSTLLIEEEDRFGSTAERLDRADAQIASGRFRIEELEHAIAALRRRGADVSIAERVLASLKEILVTFEAFREVLVDRLRRCEI